MTTSRAIASSFDEPIEDALDRLSVSERDGDCISLAQLIDDLGLA
jgi:hypothetical protein